MHPLRLRYTPGTHPLRLHYTPVTSPSPADDLEVSHLLQHQHNANKKPTKAYDLVCDLCRPQGHRPPPRLLMLSGTPSERWLHTNHTPKGAPSGPRTDPNAAGTK